MVFPVNPVEVNLSKVRLLVGLAMLVGCEPHVSSRNYQGNLGPSQTNESQVPSCSGLPKLMRITDRIFSGGTPTLETGFGDLRSLGIQVVVSVDGVRPDAETAARFGMRYVHIPVGYDGIDSHAQMSLLRLVQECEGQIYIHCHHGRHRGPAAAALAGIADGSIDNRQALAILTRAGTDPDYTGLFGAVRQFRPVRSTETLPELVSVAEVEPLVETMAKIDRAVAAIDRLLPEGSTSLDRSCETAGRQALLLSEWFRETERQADIEAYDGRFLEWLRAATATSAALESALRSNQAQRIVAARADLKLQCDRCHSAYRD